MHKDAWKSLSSKVVYENKWGKKIREHQVVRPDGEEGVFAVFEVNPGVCIVARTPKNEIYLVGQYRFPIQRYSLEIPAGGCDELEPLDAAKKELHEETGLVAERWTELGTFYLSTGSSNEKATVFLAENLTQTNHHEQEEEGIDQLRIIKIANILDMIKSGEIVDGSVMACLMMAADHLGIGFLPSQE